jgi:hypothetical protein
VAAGGFHSKLKYYLRFGSISVPVCLKTETPHAVFWNCLRFGKLLYYPRK